MPDRSAPANNEAVVREYLDAIGRRDPDRIVGFVTDDYTSVHIAARGTGLTGRDTYRARLDVFLADFPELEYEVVDLIAADDRVAVDYLMRGRYAGSGVDRAPFEIRGAFWFVLRDGLIAHRVDYRDDATFERQVGLANR
jgi:steroid delta-isomerase-like uncharacterized protein